MSVGTRFVATGRLQLVVSFEADAVHWCGADGDGRIAYQDIAALAFSRGRHVPTAFYFSARDGSSLQLNCEWLSWSAFDNVRWELEARTGLEVKRMGWLEHFRMTR